jgi:hypothetical protein
MNGIVRNGSAALLPQPSHALELSPCVRENLVVLLLTLPALLLFAAPLILLTIWFPNVAVKLLAFCLSLRYTS